MPTPGPWKIVDHTTTNRGTLVGYISVRGPNDEAICDIFPTAGHGGVGIDAARENAALIIEAAQNGLTTRHSVTYSQSAKK